MNMIIGWVLGVIVSLLIMVYIIGPMPGEHVGLSFLNGFLCTFIGGMIGAAMDRK
jgi:hypothetical protein